MERWLLKRVTYFGKIYTISIYTATNTRSTVYHMEKAINRNVMVGNLHDKENKNETLYSSRQTILQLHFDATCKNERCGQFRKEMRERKGFVPGGLSLRQRSNLNMNKERIKNDGLWLVDCEYGQEGGK